MFTELRKHSVWPWALSEHDIIYEYLKEFDIIWNIIRSLGKYIFINLCIDTENIGNIRIRIIFIF